PARGATTATSPRCTRRGAASPTGATSTACRPRMTCGPTTGGSRAPPRTSPAPGPPTPPPPTTSSTPRALTRTARALPGPTPGPRVGDSTSPDAVRTRSLAEETARVFRARVVNPRWISAMQRHGYKGAFELAATVDYLFGFDATAGVVHDWMYD